MQTLQMANAEAVFSDPGSSCMKISVVSPPEPDQQTTHVTCPSSRRMDSEVAGLQFVTLTD
jgi:hypothetical protein